MQLDRMDWDLHKMSERLCPLPILLKAYHVRLFETQFRYSPGGYPRPVEVDDATRAVRKQSRIRYNHLRALSGLAAVTDWTIDPNDHQRKELK